ncbi:hypothetical protein J2T17_006733 [Paenibacillus mucilaginosus]
MRGADRVDACVAPGVGALAAGGFAQPAEQHGLIARHQAQGRHGRRLTQAAREHAARGKRADLALQRRRQAFGRGRRSQRFAFALRQEENPGRARLLPFCEMGRIRDDPDAQLKLLCNQTFQLLLLHALPPRPIRLLTGLAVYTLWVRMPHPRRLYDDA